MSFLKASKFKIYYFLILRLNIVFINFTLSNAVVYHKCGKSWDSSMVTKEQPNIRCIDYGGNIFSCARSNCNAGTPYLDSNLKPELKDFNQFKFIKCQRFTGDRPTYLPLSEVEETIQVIKYDVHRGPSTSYIDAYGYPIERNTGQRQIGFYRCPMIGGEDKDKLNFVNNKIAYCFDCSHAKRPVLYLQIGKPLSSKKLLKE
ncbi:hypothetical protein BY996DRAFT_6784445 [Phakopsora pachyrhizi]|nr:hypothetical protein BY996DRAFT_6784445 [Phakopsora pachyrhizi]